MELVLSDEERAVLDRYVPRGTMAQRLSMRARIVLLCAEGMETGKISQRLNTTASTVVNGAEAR
jgi:DNA-binding CsgD family transcriptional regulator